MLNNTHQADPVEVALHDLCAAAYTRGYREGCEDSGSAVDNTNHGDGVSQYLQDEGGAREVLLEALSTRTIPPTAASGELVEALLGITTCGCDEDAASEIGRKAAAHITTLETRLAHMTESAGEMAKALERIGAGTPDVHPPFRSMPASELQRIAHEALAELDRTAWSKANG